MVKICNNCNLEFKIKTSDVNRGRGKFCSQFCAGQGHKGDKNPAYKHGNATRQGQSKEYKTWAGLKARCYNPKEENYRYYGGKGITVCSRWLDSFENFFEDMGKAPSNKHSIDRIDFNGNYEPSNCKWVTHKDQMNNTSFNKLITFNGQTLTQEQWGEKIGLNGTIIGKRLKRGWTVEKTLTTPHQRPHLLK